MSSMPSPISRFPLTFLSRLRFPQLFGILAALLFLDLMTPDPLPWLDEAFLFVVTLMVGALRRPEEEGEPVDVGKPPEKNVTPPAPPPAR
ncbi:MAG: DUF6116 family protein [Acidobacteriota bacterium]